MARQYIRQVERAEQKPHTPSLDPAAIPDDLVTQMLARPEFRATLDDALTRSGAPKLDTLDPAQQSDAARQLIAAMMQAQAENQPVENQLDPDEPAPETSPPPPPAPASRPRRSGMLARFFGGLMRRS